MTAPLFQQAQPAERPWDTVATGTLYNVEETPNEQPITRRVHAYLTSRQQQAAPALLAAVTTESDQDLMERYATDPSEVVSTLDPDGGPLAIGDYVEQHYWPTIRAALRTVWDLVGDPRPNPSSSHIAEIATDTSVSIEGTLVFDGYLYPVLTVSGEGDALRAGLLSANLDLSEFGGILPLDASINDLGDEPMDVSVVLPVAKDAVATFLAAFAEGIAEHYGNNAVVPNVSGKFKVREYLVQTDLERPRIFAWEVRDDFRTALRPLLTAPDVEAAYAVADGLRAVTVLTPEPYRAERRQQFLGEMETVLSHGSLISLREELARYDT